jgi:phosphoglycolate phosphatase-like HAD superfamily hydrolase
MQAKIIIVDFSGTLIKAEIAEAANSQRLAWLGLETPNEATHKLQHASKSHYAQLKSAIAEKYGVEANMKLNFTNNHDKDVVLSGNEIQTMIMTDLFRNAMYEQALQHGQNIFADGMITALTKNKSKGYKLAIVSGIRTDIISGMLAITNCPLEFDYIIGQDAILSKTNDDAIKVLNEEGKITHIIGDKKTDFNFTSDAQKIFVTWGHALGDEAEIADFTINHAEELEKIIL